MARNIKQVTHDLNPVISSINDLGQELKRALPELFKKIAPADPQVKEDFSETIEAIKILDEYVQYAIKYLAEVDDEADREGMEKRY